MSEVWLMARFVMELVGWVVSYFIIGLFLARRIRVPGQRAWIMYRLAAACAWPVVAIWLGAKWVFLNGLLFVSDQIRAIVQYLGHDRPPDILPAKPPPAVIAQSKPAPKAPRTEQKDKRLN